MSPRGRVKELAQPLRQLTYVKKGVVEWRDVPAPRLEAPEEALVRPFVAGRCDGDCLPLHRSVGRAMQLGIALHALDPVIADIAGRVPFREPFAIGHECVAQVVETGPEVRDFSEGEIVVVPWSVSCGRCVTCRRGLTSKCTETGDGVLSAYGFGPSAGPWGGAVSDLVRVPYADHMLVRVADNIDPLSVAAAGDNLADAWRCVAPHLERHPGAPVLVLGGGAKSIGLYAAGLAAALGAGRVDYLDFDTRRLQIAESLGATPTEIPKRRSRLGTNGPRGSGDYVISVEATSTSAGLEMALRSLAPGGVCTGVGYYVAKRTAVPLMHMYANSSALHIGVSHPRAVLPELLAAVRTSGFQAERVSTLVADWADAPRAYVAKTTKVVLRRDPLS